MRSYTIPHHITRLQSRNNCYVYGSAVAVVDVCLLLFWSMQVLWQQLASVTALVFAAALRRIQEVQAQMDLQPRCGSWMVQGQLQISSAYICTRTGTDRCKSCLTLAFAGCGACIGLQHDASAIGRFCINACQSGRRQ